MHFLILANSVYFRLVRKIFENQNKKSCKYYSAYAMNESSLYLNDHVTVLDVALGQ